MSDLPLSVLDLSPVPSGSAPSQALRRTIELARAAEQFGYSRYWLAEHHSLPSVTSSSPAVLMAAVAAATSSIRVGSGGIMLPNHSPLTVAESFRVLEGLYPGRIDLGIGRAPGTDQLTAYALRRSREALTADDFPQQYAELVAYVDGFDASHPFAAIRAMPDDVPLPPVWILGSSLYGGQAAAAFGTGFAFAGHFGSVDPAEAVDGYLRSFRPSGRPGAPSEPRVILAVSAIVADTEERAAELARANDLSIARLRSNRPGPLPSPQEAAAHSWSAAEREIATAARGFVTVGTPDVVREGLLARARRAQADELIVTTNVHDPVERVRSFELLAQAFALKHPADSS
ncbi:LLM class flavin-dependent oxidoreductase [Angustibacter sp. McL0619]|uniref:LLM class flavin-dependent oxidoreductase n=1 Tax=Angustibacter sp. McL0619 TaxID=3415676 RepID=UPI003CF9B6A5